MKSLTNIQYINLDKIGENYFKTFKFEKILGHTIKLLKLKRKKININKYFKTLLKVIEGGRVPDLPSMVSTKPYYGKALQV